MTTTTTSPPAEKTRTWVDQYMSGYRYSTGSAPTSSGPPTVSQVEKKEKIFQGLKCAIFTVDLTAQGAPLQTDPDDVQNVINHLQDNCGVTCKTLFGDDNSTQDVPRLPPGGFRAGSKSHEPLTHLLNIIVRIANVRLTRPRYLKDLHFHPHGVEMREKVDSEKPLKPDILGLFHPPTPDKPKISWNDVAVFIEVKNPLIEVIKQMATYARCHLAVDRRRSFSIGIAFDHKALTLHFLCFHRSGISSSLPLHLDSEDGFRSVVEHMVGILSIRDEEAFGLDMTRVKNVYRLNNRDYEIVRTISERNSIRGHSTVVYSLQLQTTGALDTPASLRSRELTRVGGEPQLPEKMVYKLSYQIEGHASEGTLLASFFGQFGIVDVAGFHICSAEESFGTTAHHFSNPRFLNLADDSADGTPEIRYLHCTAMALEGLPLLDPSDTESGIPTPAELMETILHSMIGHYNLFLGGILHRDISCGNILRLREPINRSPGRSMSLLDLPEDVSLSVCRGFLVDGDHAIEWREGAVTPSLERSGTLPFMSMHLLYAWTVGKAALHTVIDDLESFLWVLVWSLVYIFKEDARITNENSIIYHIGRALSSRNISEILLRELLVKANWTDKVFSGLIREWLNISETYRDVVIRLEQTLVGSVNDKDAQKRTWDEFEGRCGEAYNKFIRAGYAHLQTIKGFSNWKEVVDFDGELLNT